MKRAFACGALLRPDAGARTVRVERDAVVTTTDGGAIESVVTRSEFEKARFDGEVVDFSRRLVTPGLIDCHTHLIFGGHRADEFFDRLSGKTYEEIARQGGGIQKTVAQTRAASDEDLLAGARRRLDAFLKFGVTTVEAKTGYGLSVEQELRLLRLIPRLAHAVDVVPTFLGAHTVPAEFRADRQAYVRAVTDEMLPAVRAENLSGICDVFCDAIAFSNDEARTILMKARDLGLATKVHADQLSLTHGAALAAALGSLSADHLDFTDAAGMEALARAGTVGVLIPTCHLFLGKGRPPDARALAGRGVRLAISTDCNPGTSHTANLPLSMALAATELRMPIEQIWLGVTVHAARALGLKDRGAIESGMRADLCAWETLDPRDVPYAFGSAFPSAVVRAGQ